MAIRTLIVDDTVTYRKIISDVMAKFDDVEVVATAGSGSIALKKLAMIPADLVLLDVNMPDMDGLETLKRIRSQYPLMLVVMVSGSTTRSAQTTIQALEIGAIDFIPKPEGQDFAASMQQLSASFAPVLRLVQMRMHTAGIRREPVSVVGHKPVSPVPIAVPIRADASSGTAMSMPRVFGVLAIGVSTGGPEALNKLIPALPANLSVPVLMVQHMPPMFTKSLAESLDRKSPLHVKEAEEGEAIVKGTVYIAPGGRHMTVRRKDDGVVVVALNDGPPENSCRPAVDVLFRSVATTYGDKGVLSVILTGMGSDGCNGVRALKRKGCCSITQSEASCVVYGMPRAVDEAGLSDRSLGLEQIPAEICLRLNCSL